MMAATGFQRKATALNQTYHIVPMMSDRSLDVCWPSLRVGYQVQENRVASDVGHRVVACVKWGRDGTTPLAIDLKPHTLGTEMQDESQLAEGTDKLPIRARETARLRRSQSLDKRSNRNVPTALQTVTK